jgi:hypothetical protein
MRYFDNLRKRANRFLRKIPERWTSRNPIYVFHHIPKCGGTSVRQSLDNWLSIVKDYRKGETRQYPEKVDLSALRACHCLCGHFEIDGYYLHQRYPEILASDRYRIITFVRDPLQIQLSLFKYEKLKGRAKTDSIVEHLAYRPNYLANRFPAALHDYKKVIDRYFFIGILEEAQKSMDLLASMMGKRPISLPRLNQSRTDRDKDPSEEKISPKVETMFKEDNALDYLVYDYCLAKFKDLLTANGRL